MNALDLLADAFVWLAALIVIAFPVAVTILAIKEEVDK